MRWSVEDMTDFLNAPSRWPYRPRLPMKLYLTEGVLTGYLMEQQGLRVLDYDTGQPIQAFESVAALVEAGWEID